MVTAGAPWNPLKFDPNGVRETYAKMFLTLWNCYKFHADYAALDNFDPDANECPVESRPSLDRWILSNLNSVAADYHTQFEGWDFHKACRVWKNLSSMICPTSMFVEVDADCGMKATVQTVGLPTYAARRSHHALSLDCPGVAVHGRCHSPQLDRRVSTLRIGLLLSTRMRTESRMQLVHNLAEAGRKVRVDNDHRQRLPCQTGWLVGAKNIDEFYPILAEEINVLDLQTENDLDRFQESKSLRILDLGANFDKFTQGDVRTG